MGGWSHGIFGCFNNCTLCIITYFAPCYTVGKSARVLGESCLVNCLLTLIPIVNYWVICSQRGKIRAKADIRGGPIRDLAWTVFCPFCVIIQGAQECKEMNSGAMAMDMERC